VFADIPKIFDKNFLIGFFIPSLVLVVLGTRVPVLVGISIPSEFMDIKSFLDITIIVLAVWILAIVLMAVNREITRLFEGYGKFNPFRIFKKHEVACYRRLIAKIEALTKKDEKKLTDAEKAELADLYDTRAKNFPDDEKWVLPTHFGNVLRAFEVYSRVMYGAEAIVIWPRLQTVIPEEYMAIIDSSNTTVNFWINLCFATIILLLEMAGLVIYACFASLTFTWYTPLIILCACVAIFLGFYKFAIHAAYGWGETVKSAFDVYLPALAKSIGLELPAKNENRIKVWTMYRAAIQYNQTKYLPKELTLTPEDKGTD
jgi:hypothetical protein